MDSTKGPVEQTLTDVHEAVVKPMGEEFSRMLEVGVSSVTGSSPKPIDPDLIGIDPQVSQQKKVEEEKKKAWALRVIDWYKKIAEEQRKVREQKKQQQQVSLQQAEEKKQVEQYKAVESQQKKQDIALIQSQTKTETKAGVGG